MRETGLIWVLLAVLSVMTAFAFIKSAEVQKGLSRQQTAFGAQQRTIKGQQAELKRQARDAEKTTRAACTYRSFLRQEYRQGAAYLRRHPEGAPALGISAAQIAQGIARQRKAYDSLASLACKRAPAPPPKKPAS